MTRTTRIIILGLALFAAQVACSQEEFAGVPGKPFHVRVDVCFVEYTNAVIEPLVRDGKLDAATLKELWRQGMGRMIGTTFVITKAGQEAVTKSVTEYIYPTQFTACSQTPSNGEIRAENASAVVEPGGFQTREVGTILQVVPEISSDGELISLTMNPQAVRTPQWRDYAVPAGHGSDARLIGSMAQPFFPVQSISTSLTIRNGATILAGGATDAGHECTFCAFVTAQLVDSAGQPVVKANPPRNGTSGR